MSAAAVHEERRIEPEPGVLLWADATGPPAASALLLVMGANASGLVWPDELVERLAARHRVVRYDHRDTGRSTRVFADRPYAIPRLAPDALAVLDGFGIERAHVVGMSLGGTIVQLLMLDAPERLLTATLFGTSALSGDPPLPGEESLPGPSDELLAVWEHLGDERTREEDVAFAVEHWRLLTGGGPFDVGEFRALEERIRDHAGHDEPTFAHALADQAGLARGRELASVSVPALILDAPLDPVYASPHAEHLARVVPGAQLRVIPGMGHALPAPVLPAIADAILARTASY
jgi:pimeloyl-ACP methyl ester carboxylesterase